MCAIWKHVVKSYKKVMHKIHLSRLNRYSNTDLANCLWEVRKIWRFHDSQGKEVRKGWITRCHHPSGKVLATYIECETLILLGSPKHLHMISNSRPTLKEPWNCFEIKLDFLSDHYDIGFTWNSTSSRVGYLGAHQTRILAIWLPMEYDRWKSWPHWRCRTMAQLVYTVWKIVSVLRTNN